VARRNETEKWEERRSEKRKKKEKKKQPGSDENG
jgi:hypothetical protein